MQTTTNITNKVRVLAFYLPQFHPIPENDEWWGKGFTEWTNVAKATPLFPGHYQPHIPADLGFYDLRLGASRIAQAELAKSSGISGFCYWHYWFNGRRLLELPFNEVLASGEPDFPFCLAWANENWTRRWDGAEQEVLLSQNYMPEDDVEHIRWLINAFRDRRYITVEGKPLLMVYRINLLPDPIATANIWREEIRKAGLPGLYLCTITGLPELDIDPQTIGFDAAVEFQPNWGKLPPPLPYPRNTILGKIDKRFAPQGREAYWEHNIRTYQSVVDAMMALENPTYKQFPGVTPSWDNSARRKRGACIFRDSDPSIYGNWLRHAIEKSMKRFNGDERLVFINAWNEWAEGNHLEPDIKWGTRFLDETRAVIDSFNKNE